VTGRPLPSDVFEVQITHLGGGIDDGAGDAGFLGGGVEVRDGIAGGSGEFDTTDGDEGDGEAVHAVADVAFVPSARSTSRVKWLLLVREPPPAFHQRKPRYC
jgi:hypothetical protein